MTVSGPVIKVIADSVCDVPRDLAARLDITLIPAVVHIEGKSYLDDDVQITRSEFYQRLPGMKTLPTTSACPLGLTRDMMAEKARQADHLVLLTPPERLSGIYNTFRLAAEEVVPGRYTLIDTGQVTMGAGFLVLAAAEAAINGAGIAAIRRIIADMRPRINVFGALSTLENLRRSGRVGWAAAMAATILQVKPVVELTQGEVRSVANIRTFKRATERLIELARERAPLERLAVLHTGYLDGALALRAALAPVFPPEETPVVNVNPPLGTHVGARGLGIALVTTQ